MVLFPEVALDDMLRIAIVAHGSDDRFNDIQIVDLVIQVEITAAFKLSVFNEDRAFFINIAPSPDEDHILVFIGITGNKLFYAFVIGICRFLFDTGAMTAFNSVIEAIAATVMNAAKAGAEFVLLDPGLQ